MKLDQFTLLNENVEYPLYARLILQSKNAELESHLKEREETFHKSQTDAKRLDMDLDVVTRERVRPITYMEAQVCCKRGIKVMQ